ncbi:superoxide dismutase family protein [Histidinibacterium lentulum]|nr:superoxide dismutase family protein [Histidinibacterium lentulum]
MRPILPVAAALLAAGPALAESHMSQGGWIAEVQGRDGAAHGTVTVEPTASGTMVVELDLAGLPTGTLAVHLHETGDCSAEDFSSAGGHIAGDASHGVESADGPHPGDLPNVLPEEGGAVQVQFFNDRLTGEMMTDADGAAFVVHAGADDYESQPAGDAGDRIACGVFEPRE